VRTAVERIGHGVGAPLLYVPDGKCGFVLAPEHGTDPASAPRALESTTTALGFEVAAELPGIARLPPSTDKDVFFLIDVSGSMSGRRLQNATNNALNIFDRFTTDEDHIGLAHFHHKFAAKIKMHPRHRSHRASIDQTRRADLGGTAFYDALIEASKWEPRSTNSYLVALTDGADMDSRSKIEAARDAIAGSPWTLLVIGLEVHDRVRTKCESLAHSSQGGMYMHAGDAGAGLDAAFAKVAAQFVMPKVKSADAAASGGGARGV